jgi:uncharacterized protein (TIGR01319 family)
MPTSLVEGNSLLAVDIGSVNTRAAYFDVVEGRYRFIAMGQARTTAAPPTSNVIIGVQDAIHNLQNLVGKILIDDDGRLVIPSQPDGTGVDSLATSVSVGSPIKTVVVGLLSDVSLKSVENLAQTTYTRVIDTFGMNDPRRMEEQVDAIFRNSPELILIAGGTDGGATISLQKLLEMIGLASFLQPESRRPAILYAGNQTLAKDVEASLKNISSGIAICPNIRPALELEDLAPAQRELANIVTQIREKQLPQLHDVRYLSGGILLPSAYAQGRMVRFLARYFGSGKGVLNVDLGASALSMAVSFDGDLNLNVFPQFGMGEPLSGLLRHVNLEDIERWLSIDVSREKLRDYLYQKSIYPATIPATKEELTIEQAIARHSIYVAIRSMAARFPERFQAPEGQLPQFEPIIASGATITNAPTAGQKLLMLLDGIQPVGVTTIVLDQNNMLSMLGVAAEQNNLLPVQVLDSGALSYLAKVICPVGNASYGTPILNMKLILEDGTTTEIETKMGAFNMLPVPSGRMARLQLRPIGRTDVGYGPGKGMEVEVVGSPLGVVVDARGRPLKVPADAGARRDLHAKWLSRVGG